MAKAVVSGVTSIPGADVVVKFAEDDVIASDAVIVGSPVHMGSPDWRVKKFIDQVCGPLWIKDSLIGKVGAVFAAGGGYGNTGGGAELTMLALLNNFVENNPTFQEINARSYSW
ncbi:flavodoxin family protein [Trichocoleus sp. FACHB-591]|nr:flavodoxin family protein [Trichocoleus sp. FACHB-591]